MPHLGDFEILVILVIVVLVAIPFRLVPYWFIFRKAGFHPALSLLMIVPIASLIMRFFLAFAEWPSLKKATQSTN
jgi:hypothetical protein